MIKNRTSAEICMNNAQNNRILKLSRMFWFSGINSEYQKYFELIQSTTYSFPNCYEYPRTFAKNSKRTNCSGQHIDNRRQAIVNKYVHLNRIMHCFLISQHTDNLFLFICALILSDGVSKSLQPTSTSATLEEDNKINARMGLLPFKPIR